MRARVIAHGALAFAVGASVVACVDLFHGTEFESACDADAAACEAVDANVVDVAVPPVPDAGSDGPTDFCQWDAATALTVSQHACAWLGSCEGALGDNAFGTCMFHAMLAYDCAANPNLPLVAASATHAYWDCLAKAHTCTEVDRCVEPLGSIERCAATDNGYAACNAANGTIITCAAGTPDGGTPASIESCSALGQTCSGTGAPTCSALAAACTSVALGISCNGSELHDCDPDGGPIDYGLDCASVGSGACSGLGGCGAIDGGSCTPTSDVTCAGGVAIGCPSGTIERIDCNAALGQPSGTSACDEGAPGRLWDVSRACSLGTCGPERCSGTTLASCARGAPITIACTSVGFTRCDDAPYPHCAN